MNEDMDSERPNACQGTGQGAYVLDGTEGQSVQVQGYVLLSFLWFTLHSGEKPPPRP